MQSRSFAVLFAVFFVLSSGCRRPSEHLGSSARTVDPTPFYLDWKESLNYMDDQVIRPAVDTLQIILKRSDRPTEWRAECMAYIDSVTAAHVKASPVTSDMLKSDRWLATLDSLIENF